VPSLKAIGKQKLYRPDIGQPEAYPNLQRVLTKPIDWELIRQRYDHMVNYATALRLGTAEAEAILRRFTRNNYVQLATYKALSDAPSELQKSWRFKDFAARPIRRATADQYPGMWSPWR
jgi:TnpA family transposase